jgi:hypothetical protein
MLIKRRGEEMNYNSQEESLGVSLINSSLEDVYCNTTLSNHYLIRFNRFVS